MEHTYYNDKIVLNPNIEDNGIIKKNVKIDGNNYKILKYNKEDINDNKELFKYRSVIFNDDMLLSYSLPKSIKYNDFIEKNKDIMDENIVITEIIEGTMINLFYNPSVNKWDIASKGAIGGNYFFYRNGYDKSLKKKDQLTFKMMLLQSLGLNTEEEFIEFTDKLSRKYCYSFVLQHPENHIVLNINTSKLYLISVWLIEDKSATYIPIKQFKEFTELKKIESYIHYPNVYEKEDNYNEIINKYISDNNKLIVGLMYINEKTLDRASIIHETYKKMKDLRGNNPNLQYQYLTLKKIDKINEFLTFFPQYKDIFYKFYIQYRNFLRDVHQAYFNLYIKKHKTSHSVKQKYHYHCNKLHYEIYLPSLTEGNKKIMNKTEVYNYFEKYDPIQQLYYLNYETENN
jgi:hypothetical protein